jgi:hypothetical protein
MAEFEKGQTFLDLGATNFCGSKGKYFIGLSTANFDDDIICCFVLNTEKRMDRYRLYCNKEAQKFIIPPQTFSFITDYTSIMLHQAVVYRLKEIYDDRIKLKDLADDTLARQIKNCVNRDSISVKHYQLIRDSFKD